MKQKLFILFLLATVFTVRVSASTENRIGSDHDYTQGPFFVFIVPSYNNAKYYTKNLNSIFCQTYSFFHVI